MKVVLLGLGRYVEEITEIVSGFADTVLIEREEVKLKSFLEKGVKNLRVVPGNATDMELWKRIDLSEVEAVISFLDTERTLSVAKLLRRALGFEGTFVFVAKERPEGGEVKELGIEVISVPDVLGALLKNLLKGKGVVNYPVGIGLRKGEVAQVLITESSPVSFMKLSEIIQRRLRVALIYRGGKIILPRTDIRVQPGDRLLVVGEPSQVELFVSTATKGTPNFPLKWGTKGITCGASSLKEEFDYIREKVKVREWVEEVCDSPWQEEDAGLIVALPDRVDDLFGNSKVPSLILKGSFPYKRILVSANTDAIGFLLPTAVELGRLFEAEVFLLIVTSIEKMLTREEKEFLERLKSFVDRTKKLGTEIKLIRKEGNPVRETLKLLKGGFNLLAVGYTPGRKSSFWKPYTPHLLAKRTSLSTLLVPEVSFER